MAGRKVLFVNACVNRSKSRTQRLANALISRFDGDDVEEIVLEDLTDLRPIDSRRLNLRESLLSEGKYDDAVFVLARKLAEADVVVMASPFWEDSYNSMLKMFLENASAVGITFRYSPEGVPIPLCRAKELYYITTRGGPICDDDDLGYRNICSLAKLYGMDVTIFSASALDMPFTDVESELEKVIAKMPQNP